MAVEHETRKTSRWRKRWSDTVYQLSRAKPIHIGCVRLALYVWEDLPVICHELRVEKYALRAQWQSTRDIDDILTMCCEAHRHAQTLLSSYYANKRPSAENISHFCLSGTLCLMIQIELNTRVIDPEDKRTHLGRWPTDWLKTGAWPTHLYFSKINPVSLARDHRAEILKSAAVLEQIRALLLNEWAINVDPSIQHWRLNSEETEWINGKPCIVERVLISINGQWLLQEATFSGHSDEPETRTRILSDRQAAEEIFATGNMPPPEISQYVIDRFLPNDDPERPADKPAVNKQLEPTLGWSEPRSTKEWQQVFGVTWSAIKKRKWIRMIREGKARRWSVAIDDLPPAAQEKYKRRTQN